MSEEIISFIDFTVMSDEEKYKLLNIRDNRISSLNIVNEELKYKLQQKENIIKEVREYIENNSLYEQDYDYDYEENLVEYPPSDEQARKDILGILDKENKQ